MSTINLQGGNTLLSTGMFPPVRAASTGSPLNPATGGLLTVDGITLAVGDRVLCKDESSPVNNGIYAASTGPWVRTSDANGNTQFFNGMTVTVGPGGALNAGQTFMCTCTDDPVVVGTSLLTFASQTAVQTAQQSATSTTSLTIGTGSKTLAVQSGKAFLPQQWVLIQETSNAANQMLGQVTSYSGTTLVVNVTATGGSGTHADWTIVLTNSPAAAGFQPPVGSGNVTGPGSSTAGHIATFADSSGKVLQDSGTIAGAYIFSSTISVAGKASFTSTDSMAVANGTTAQRNGSPSAGDLRFNSTLAALEYWNGTVWITLGRAPTVQRLTSGLALTYTPTAGMVRIKVRMCGGGGGGSAVVTNSGSNGGDTSFGSWTAVHGNGGGTFASNGGVGGTGGTGGVNGTGTLVVRFTGGQGQAAANNVGTNAVHGGQGGTNPFGGAGAGSPGQSSAGGNAAANTGAGGGGAGMSQQVPSNTGSGGGAGEYVEFWMTAAQVGANQTYTVGTGGNGGAAGGLAGGNGAAGIIIIEEFYI